MKRFSRIFFNSADISDPSTNEAARVQNAWNQTLSNIINMCENRSLPQHLLTIFSPQNSEILHCIDLLDNTKHVTDLWFFRVQIQKPLPYLHQKNNYWDSNSIFSIKLLCNVSWFNPAWMDFQIAYNKRSKNKPN